MKEHFPSRLGVDTGGTFTDFVWQTPAGELRVYKTRSTPADPSRAILDGVTRLSVPTEAAVIHGSTVATNALLERRGARTALITTTGFADVLAIGRQNRPQLYALNPQKPPPLVPARWCFEVDARLDPVGNAISKVNSDEIEILASQIASEPIESIAICLLFSYVDGHQEQAIASLLRKQLSNQSSTTALSLSPSLSLSLSSEILPEYREYERTSTTVINAYVAPLMGRYLSRLEEKIAPRPLTVMQSNGGLIQARTAGEQAARTALSGPAGGVVGAFFVAQQAGFSNLITFDMGGTSTDVSLCPGRLPTTTRGSIADLPLRLPIIDIHTVGAGGGSIAHVDAGSALLVGPESAGADPGPACYPRLRDDHSPLRPTVTDANVVLGRLDPNHFLGGDMTLNIAAAKEAIRQLHSEDIDLETAAWGVIQVANAHMERAIRKISVERGYDPRDFVLVPFGGAGPLHACDLAAQLQIQTVIIPPSPGVLSALGMLVAAPTKDYSQTLLRPLTAADTLHSMWLQDAFQPLIDRARHEMAAEGHDSADLIFERSLDMRYRGQSHELRIRLDGEDSSPTLADSLHEAHKGRFGYDQPGEPVELVTARLTATAPAVPVRMPRLAISDKSVDQAVIGHKDVWFDGRRHPTTLYNRDLLGHQHAFTGPAVVFQYDTTTVIPPAWKAKIDQFGNMILHVPGTL